MRVISKHWLLLAAATASLLFTSNATAGERKIYLGHRPVWVLVPPGLAPEGGYPLVVALHWAGARGHSYVSAWSPFYRKQRVIVAFPTAVGTRWHAGDGHHVRAVVTMLGKRFKLNRSRIYLAGFSRGGSYAYHFGISDDSPFTAVAPIAAGLVSVRQTRRKVDVCILHGASDRLVRPERSAKMVSILKELGHHVDIWFVDGMHHQHKQAITPYVWRCLDRRYRQYQRMLHRERLRVM